MTRLRIVFVMRHSGFVRNFESALEALAARGHEVHLSFEVPRDQAELAEALAARYPNVTWSTAPPRRDRWTGTAYGLRRAIDGLRYRSPVYDAAPKLRRRGLRGLPSWLRRVTARPRLRAPRVLSALEAALRRCDEALPVAPVVDAALAAYRPDRVLVTPLVDGPTQSDWVRAARRRCIPCALAVTSWDNLTNKGLIHDALDAVLVWNEAQVREAVELHGVRPELVHATGAHSYDHWFGWRPGTDRAALCARTGLPPDRPLLLYLCSSSFIAPDEPRFVARWLEALRRTAPAPLRDAAVLVRPHPANGEAWAGVDLSGLGPVAVWPPRGADPRTAQAKADYYDSMALCDAAVGINTSAIVELAIVGRPAFTVLAPEFAETQEGTLHFAHLTGAGGGVLRVGRDLDEHFTQLAAALADGRGPGVTEPFVRAFVRPHGLDEEGAPRFADAVERLRLVGSPPGRRAADPLIRALLWPLPRLWDGKARRRAGLRRRVRRAVRRARHTAGALAGRA